MCLYNSQVYTWLNDFLTDWLTNEINSYINSFWLLGDIDILSS